MDTSTLALIIGAVSAVAATIAAITPFIKELAKEAADRSGKGTATAGGGRSEPHAKPTLRGRYQGPWWADWRSSTGSAASAGDLHRPRCTRPSRSSNSGAYPGSPSGEASRFLPFRPAHDRVLMTEAPMPKGVSADANALRVARGCCSSLSARRLRTGVDTLRCPCMPIVSPATLTCPFTDRGQGRCTGVTHSC